MTNEEINIAIAQACGWTDVWNPVMSTSPVLRWLKWTKKTMKTSSSEYNTKCIVHDKIADAVRYGFRHGGKAGGE